MSCHHDYVVHKEVCGSLRLSRYFNKYDIERIAAGIERNHSLGKRIVCGKQRGQ